MNIYYIIILIIIILYFYFNKKQYNNQYINTIHYFISDDECDKLIELSKNRFIDSTIYDIKSDKVDKLSRSSKNVYFKRGENELIRKLEDRVCSMFNLDKNQLEPLQIVKYDKGNEYRYHYDYFDEKSDQSSNQRIYSILIYLNTLNKQDGGCTHFPIYKKRIRPEKGKMVYWENKQDNELNKQSLHCGEPIKTDTTKYILTIWTRERGY